MTVRLKTTPSPPEATQAASEAPRLWGHPLPTNTGPGDSWEYHGTHWTKERHEALVEWIGQATQTLRTRILMGDQALEEAAQTEANAHAFRVRWERMNPGRPFGFAELREMQRQRPRALSPEAAQALADLVSRRKAARDSILRAAVRKIGPTVSTPTPRWDEVLRWAMSRTGILARLGAMGLLPRLPAWLIPAGQANRNTRADRLDGKPSDAEDKFA